MPRPRSKRNAGLPPRWDHIHGAYYYLVPVRLRHLWDGKARFRLGATLPEAFQTYGARVQAPQKIPDCNALLDRYALEVVPGKAPKTRKANLASIVRLKRVFGAMPVAGGAVKPKHVYKYVSTGTSQVSGLRDIEVFSHAFTKAVEWGEIDRHPFKGEVRIAAEHNRPTRPLEDWEIREMLAMAPRRKNDSVAVVQAYIRLKLLCGLSRGDMLRLRADEHLKEDGIHVTRNKTKDTTGKTTVYTYEQVPERRQAVEEARRVRPVLSPYLFCMRDGSGYLDEETGEAPGWKSLWFRFVQRVLAETKVSRPFTELSLRATVGSNAESLERARALLAHSDTRTTLRFYRLRPERV